MTRSERVKHIIQEALNNSKSTHLKSWFKKSKVIDAYGEPVTAHNHKDNITQTIPVSNQAHHYPGIISKGERHTLSKDNEPIYTSLHRDNISKPKGFYLKIENPYHITHFTNWVDDNMLNQMIRKGLIADKEYNQLQKLSENKRTPLIVEILKKHGYDGVVYAFYKNHQMLYQWLAFDENDQVKAIHTFNNQNSVDNGGDDQDSGSSGLD